MNTLICQEPQSRYQNESKKHKGEGGSRNKPQSQHVREWGRWGGRESEREREEGRGREQASERVGRLRGGGEVEGRWGGRRREKEEAGTSHSR